MVTAGLPPAHEYREAPDEKYPHLRNPQCRCGGLRVSGYVTRFMAGILYERHVNAR